MTGWNCSTWLALLITVALNAGCGGAGAACVASDGLEACRRRGSELRARAAEGGVDASEARAGALRGDQVLCDLGEVPACRRLHAYWRAAALGLVETRYRDLRTTRERARDADDPRRIASSVAREGRDDSWRRLRAAALAEATHRATLDTNAAPFLEYRAEFPGAGDEESPFRTLVLSSADARLAGAYISVYGPACAGCAEVTARLVEADFEALGLASLSDEEAMSQLRRFHALHPSAGVDREAAEALALRSEHAEDGEWYLGVAPGAVES